MATAHVTRARGARSVRTRSTPKPPTAAPAAQKPAARKRAASPSSGTFRPNAFHSALREMALRLEVLFATCVTVRLALEGQSAAQDEEIARCLMYQVTGPLWQELEKLQAMARSLGRRSAAGQSVRR
jgi:hypothetical protein